MAAEPTDKELVKRVQKGDKGAFDLLVLKYEHKIVNLVMRYVRDPEQALDISQEAFIKAYRALPRFRGDSAFYTWLYRIAVNTAKNYLAAQRRRPMDIELDLQDPEQYGLHAKLKETDTPEAVTLSDELQETLERAIEALPDDLRTAIILRELDGMMKRSRRQWIAPLVPCGRGFSGPVMRLARKSGLLCVKRQNL
jgi:RNA polymerase sigma-70 factor (ECF subfamily)